ncbi:MAG: DUF4249 domain-containing protein [Muribaculaceae bacterium]|nr:DUF4249 domain-containing protein [Muribaculaceae bacterium]
MAILKYILPILLATVLTGCYEDFNPDVDTKPVLCMNSLITVGEPIYVYVSRSWLFTDKQAAGNHQVTDAKVTVIVNGNVVDADYLPQEGDKIYIIAESRTYGTATAEVQVPFAAPIGKVNLTPTVTDIWKGLHYEMLADITFDLNFELDVVDHPGYDNYYNLSYEKNNPDSNDAKFTLNRLDVKLEPIFKEHIDVLESIMVDEESYDFLYFSDQQFAGKAYTLHLNFTDNYYSVSSRYYDESLLDCGITFCLSTISRSYYNWAVYKWNVTEGIIGDLAEVGLAESKWGYSNVSTGAGVVAAKSETQYTVSLKEFLKQFF